MPAVGGVFIFYVTVSVEVCLADKMSIWRMSFDNVMQATPFEALVPLQLGF